MFDLNLDPASFSNQSFKIVDAGFGRIKYLDKGYTLVRLAETTNAEGKTRYELSIFVGGQEQERLSISRPLFYALFTTQNTKELYFDRVVFDSVESRFEVYVFYSLDSKGEETWRKSVVRTLSPKKSPPVWVHDGKEITDPLFEYWFFREVNKD